MNNKNKLSTYNLGYVRCFERQVVTDQVPTSQEKLGVAINYSFVLRLITSVHCLDYELYPLSTSSSFPFLFLNVSNNVKCCRNNKSKKS